MTNAGVIFDMDGVLVDTTPLCVDITWRLLNRLGIHLAREELFSFVGISVSEMWGKLKSEFCIHKSIAELVQDQKHAQLNRILEMGELPPVSGIEELLIELNELGLPCAVASSSSPELISLLLSKARLNGYFICTVSGEDVPNGKPASDIFLLAARKLKANPASCLVIEDSPHGIEGAKAAGMTTIGYKNPTPVAKIFPPQMSKYRTLAH